MIVIYVVQATKQASIVSIPIPIEELMIVFTLTTAKWWLKKEKFFSISGNVPLMALEM